MRSRAVTGRGAPAPDDRPNTTVPDIDTTARDIPVTDVQVTGGAIAAEAAADPVGADTPVTDGTVAAATAAAPAGADTPATALLGLAAAASAASVTALPTITPSVCTESSQACAYIVGPSGEPIPDQTYIDVAMGWYLQPNSPGTVFTPQVIFTPEGAYPITGVKQLPIDPSSQEGLTEVRETIEATLQVLEPGTPISYFGYSQSAIISSLLQIYQAGC